MVKIKKVKAKTGMERVNLEIGRKYYFGPSPRRKISTYFKTVPEMMRFYKNIIKWQKQKDKWLTEVEKKKQHLYVLVK